MTEYELLDTFTTTQAVMHSWSTTYFSVVTAYLVAAYAIGARLTRSQVFVATTCFVLFSALCAWGMLGTGLRMLELKTEIRMLNPEREFLFGMPGLLMAYGVTVAGILVALKFMWDVRHPRPS